MWNFDEYQSNIAMKDEFGTALTYDELHKEDDKLYEVINRRCLVFCLCTNSIGSIIGYTSFIQNDVVSVLLNAHLEKELLNNLLNSYCPSICGFLRSRSSSLQICRLCILLMSIHF